EAVGYVSSGGYAHRIGRSMAMGYVATEHSEAGSALSVEILGDLYAAEVQGAPLYDANGANMRA
ncbi:MAG: glycine cleavage T C-terminal barrel domain-containing protein, partial [Pseudomonadota bacterium]